MQSPLMLSLPALHTGLQSLPDEDPVPRTFQDLIVTPLPLNQVPFHLVAALI
jgi:hypothetical protein